MVIAFHARCRGFESRHPLVKRGCSSEVEHCPNRTNMTVAPYVGEPVAAARSPKPRPGGSTPPTSANVTVWPFGPAWSGRLIVDQEIAGSSPAGVASIYRPGGSAGRARGEGEIDMPASGRTASVIAPTLPGYIAVPGPMRITCPAQRYGTGRSGSVIGSMGRRFDPGRIRKDA